MLDKSLITITNPALLHPEMDKAFTDALPSVVEMSNMILDPTLTPEARLQVRAGINEYGNISMDDISEDLKSKVNVKEFSIKGLKEGQPDIELLVVTPIEVSEGKRSCLLDVHSGGWLYDSNRSNIRDYMRSAINDGCVVVAPNYYYAPEFQHQEIIDSLEATVNWIIEGAEEMNIDTNRVAVRGNSAGAHLSAAISHRMKLRDNGFQFSGQMLLSPMLDDRSIYQSAFESTETLWNVEASVKSWKAFLGDDYGTPYVPEDAAPARATNFKGLPPTFLYVAELDHDRDACIEYAKNLMQAGVFVNLYVYGGMFHSFGILDMTSDASKEFRTQFKRNQTRALSGKFVR